MTTFFTVLGVWTFTAALMRGIDYIDKPRRKRA